MSACTVTVNVTTGQQVAAGEVLAVVEPPVESPEGANA